MPRHSSPAGCKFYTRYPRLSVAGRSQGPRAWGVGLTREQRATGFSINANGMREVRNDPQVTEKLTRQRRSESCWPSASTRPLSSSTRQEQGGSLASRAPMHQRSKVAKFPAGNPVLSVDATTKERVEEVPEQRTRRPEGPVRVNAVCAFPELAPGCAIACGAYDLGRDREFVNAETNHDAAELRVEGLRWRWRRHGDWSAVRWLVCADGGGSNGSRDGATMRHRESRQLTPDSTHAPPRSCRQVPRSTRSDSRTGGGFLRCLTIHLPAAPAAGTPPALGICTTIILARALGYALSDSEVRSGSQYFEKS